MRSFYTAPDGRTADLCKHMHRESTHLIVRSPEGHTLHTWWYDTWQDAVDALREMMPCAVNDLTHQPLA